MTKSSDTEYVVIGKIGAPFGIKGWVKILTFTEWVENVFEYNPWYMEDESGWREIKVTGGQQHGKGIIAKLVGFDTPEQAKLLMGIKLAVKRSQLPPLEKNEYYWSDLEGLTVINQDGKELGKIIYIMETGSNDVLVIKSDKEYGIPYLPGTVVLSVDLEKREMHVNWELI